MLKSSVSYQDQGSRIPPLASAGTELGSALLRLVFEGDELESDAAALLVGVSSFFLFDIITAMTIMMTMTRRAATTPITADISVCNQA